MFNDVGTRQPKDANQKCQQIFTVATTGLRDLPGKNNLYIHNIQLGIEFL